MAEVASLYRCNCGLDQRGCRKNTTQIVCGELDYRNLTVPEVLLVLDVLVGGYEDIKLTFGKSEKFTILNASPSARTRGAALVAHKDFVHRPGRTLIK